MDVAMHHDQSDSEEEEFGHGDEKIPREGDIFASVDIFNDPEWAT